MKKRKIIIIVSVIILTALGARILLRDYYTKKSITELLNGVSSSSLENPRYFEYSIRPDYNYPKIILMRFDCSQDAFLKIKDELKLVSQSDTSQMNKEVFLTDIQTKKHFWNMNPEFYPKGERERIPTWWEPCNNEIYAYYFLEKKGGVVSMKNFDGRISGTYCDDSAFFLIYLYIHQ